MLLLWCLTAMGQSLQPAERDRPQTPEGLIADLIDGRPPDQLYAARELKRLAKIGLSDLSHRDPVRQMEARQYLVIFDDVLAPACIEHLDNPRLAAPCADILGLLETEAALPVLRSAEPDAGRRASRRIRRAIRAIEES